MTGLFAWISLIALSQTYVSVQCAYLYYPYLFTLLVFTGPVGNLNSNSVLPVAFQLLSIVNFYNKLYGLITE